MPWPAFRRKFGALTLSAALLVICPRAAGASDILVPGFDLFDPLPGSKFFVPGVGLVPFVGQPLGSFDFGPGVGIAPTFNTDTIIERLETANPPFDTVAIELHEMQMASIIAFDVGAGLGIHYFTLQAAPSTGTMTFTDTTGWHGPPPPAHGQFQYDSISVNWELHLGSFGGPLALTGTTVLSSSLIRWTHFRPNGAVVIPGLSTTFYPMGRFALNAADGTKIFLSNRVPEPSMLLLLVVSATAAATRAQRRRR